MRKIKISPTVSLAGRMLLLLGITGASEDPNNQEETSTYAHPQAAMKGIGDTHFSSQAYMLAKQRVIEAEAEKAMLIQVSRHTRWKAGGPH